MSIRVLFCLALLGLSGCQPSRVLPPTNPPAPGFDAKNSDQQAIAIADEVMQAQGGRQAWDETRVIQWTFFGRRTLSWDKWTGDVRIDWLKRPLKIILNLHSGQGKVQLDGLEQTHPDSLAKYLDLGRKVWINDSYWLVMPFKLKDSGVTLRYLGDNNTSDGRPANLLQLTFAGVGVTPDNKYHVWVDQQTRLVTQWAYFEKFSEEKPQLQNPWTDYARYGRLLLSTGRGKEEGSMAPIKVFDQPPAGLFEQF